MTDRLDLSTGSSLTTTWSPDHRREWYEKNTEIKLLQLSSSFLILAHVLSRAQTGSRGLIFRMRTDVHRPHAAYSTILDPLRPPPAPPPYPTFIRVSDRTTCTETISPRRERLLWFLTARFYASPLYRTIAVQEDRWRRWRRRQDGR